MSARAVFIMAEADRMVPQSASPEAANAFLKLLEEPPPFAFLILTSGRPAALLPTIRSRAASLRVPPLGEETVAGYLEEEVGAEATAARRAARLSEGSIGRARTLLEGDDDDAVEVADRLLAAALGGAAARYRAANEFSARGARAILAPALEGLQRRLRDVLCGASGVPDEALDPSIAQRAAGRRGITGPAVLAALEYVERALEGVQQNLNPQASVAVLLSDMSRAFAEPGGAPGA